MPGSLQHEMSAGELEELTHQIRLMTDAQLDDAIKELRRTMSPAASHMADLVMTGLRLTEAHGQAQKKGKPSGSATAEQYWRRMGGRKLWGHLREQASRAAQRSVEYSAEQWMADTSRAIAMAMGDAPITITKLLKGGEGDDDGDEGAVPVPVELAIKTTDLQAAAAHLRLMGQRLQLLTDKVQHSGRVDGRKLVKLVNRAGKAGQALIDELGLASGDDDSGN
jgi:hypothetical protein